MCSSDLGYVCMGVCMCVWVCVCVCMCVCMGDAGDDCDYDGGGDGGGAGGDGGHDDDGGVYCTFTNLVLLCPCRWSALMSIRPTRPWRR